MCRRRSAPVRSRSIPTTTRGRGSRAMQTEDRGELGRRSDLELIVAAVRGSPVGTPAEEDGRVAEAIALHVIVLHLADTLDPEWLPREILARAPATLPARHPDGAVGRSGPVPP